MNSLPKITHPKSFNPTLKKNCDEEAEQTTILNLKDQIYLHHLKEREIIINEVITDIQIEKTVLQIINFNKYDNEQVELNPKYERTPIYIYLNTVGGNIDECFSIISAIQSSLTPVVTVVLGKAYSAGFLIAISGHYRVAQAFSQFMYHQGSGGLGGLFNDIKKYSDYIMKLQTRIEGFVKSKTKMTKKQIKDIFEHNDDYYIFSEEALQLGIIDQII